jgi:hypothetical protein
MWRISDVPYTPTPSPSRVGAEASSRAPFRLQPSPCGAGCSWHCLSKVVAKLGPKQPESDKSEQRSSRAQASTEEHLHPFVPRLLSPNASAHSLLASSEKNTKVVVKGPRSKSSKVIGVSYLPCCV